MGHYFSHTMKEESRYCRMTQLHMAMQVYFSTRATCDALIDVNAIVRSTLFPFYNMHVVTLKKFSVVCTSSLTSLL